MRLDWKTSFRAVWIAEFIAIAGFQTSTPILPFYLADLGVKGAAALNFWNGTITATTSLALALVAPLWGSLSDSYGKKPMLLRATAGGALLLGLMAFVTAPWQLLVLKILQGAVTGTVAAATVLVATIVPEEEVGYRLGLLQVAVFLGSSSGPLLGGVIGDLVGNRANFLFTAVLLAIASFLVGRYVHEDHRPRPKEGGFRPRLLPDFSALGANPLLLALLFCAFAIQVGSGIANPILPLIVQEMTGDAAGTATLSGLIIGGAAISGALAAALIGKISGRFGYGRTLVACLFLSFVFYIPQGLTHSPWILLALRMVAGAFMGGTMPSVNALLARTADRENQGAVFGLSSSFSSGGAALGPVLGALVATAAGYSSVFFATGAILCLTGLLIWRGTKGLVASPAAKIPEEASILGGGIGDGRPLD